MTTVLATGGAGYIGSHVVAELLAGGRRVVVLDDFSNASPRRASSGSRRWGPGGRSWSRGDICDPAALDAAFAARSRIDAVVHIAGLKAVGESVARAAPLLRVNVGGAVALFEAMLRARGRAAGLLLVGDGLRGAGAATRSRRARRSGRGQPLRADQAGDRADIDDLVVARPDFAAVSLRYFNPVGAHGSGLIGEDPRGVPNNLFPYIAQTAAGLRERVAVYRRRLPDAGRDGDPRLYPRGRPGARASGGARLPPRRREARGGTLPINLGCGRGHSVLEAVAAFARAVGPANPLRDRRRGGRATSRRSVADAAPAAELLGWRAELDLDGCAPTTGRSRAGSGSPAEACAAKVYGDSLDAHFMHDVCTTHAQCNARAGCDG